MHEKWVVAGIGVLTLGALLYINLINMDEKIVASAPKRHDQRDVFYITNLSEDAYGGWKEAIEFSKYRWYNEITQLTEFKDNDKEQLANIKLALISLRHQRERLEKKYGDKETVNEQYINKIADEYEKKREVRQIEKDRAWQAFNVTEKKAWDKLNTDRDLFYKDVDNILGQIEVYQKAKRIDLYSIERWILYDFEYPFVNIINYRPEYINIEPECKIYTNIKDCDAHSASCAWYFCSNACWQRGTSNVTACSTLGPSNEQAAPSVSPVNDNLYR